MSTGDSAGYEVPARVPAIASTTKTFVCPASNTSSKRPVRSFEGVILSYAITPRRLRNVRSSSFTNSQSSTGSAVGIARWTEVPRKEIPHKEARQVDQSRQRYDSHPTESEYSTPLASRKNRFPPSQFDTKPLRPSKRKAEVLSDAPAAITAADTQSADNSTPKVAAFTFDTISSFSVKKAKAAEKIVTPDYNMQDLFSDAEVEESASHEVTSVSDPFQCDSPEMDDTDLWEEFDSRVPLTQSTEFDEEIENEPDSSEITTDPKKPALAVLRLLREMPFAGQWEVLRFIQPSGPLTWLDINVSLMQRLSAVAPVDIYSHLIRHYRSISGTPSGDSTQGATEYTVSIPRSMIGKVDPHEIFIYPIVVDHDGKETVIRLQPITTNRGHRAARKYGAERFLSVKFTDKVQAHVFKTMKIDCRYLRIADYIYEFVQEKSALSGKYFATKRIVGEGEEEREEVMDRIEDFIEWHYPLRDCKANLDRLWVKFVARIDLAFSGSKLGSQIKDQRLIEDISRPHPKTGEEQHFTDGCGLISRTALRELRQVLDWDTLPSAIQGRLGAAKGVWLLDPVSLSSDERYVKTRRTTQVKYELPREALDPDHHTHMDVLQPARAMPGHLNQQFIYVLESGGAPHAVFGELAEQTLVRVRESLYDKDMLMVAKSLELYGGVYKLRFDADVPRAKVHDAEVRQRRDERVNKFEICLQLIRAGFTPYNTPYLARCMDGVYRMLTKRILAKCSIDVPLSRRVLMVPDPLNLLLPHQVFLQLSQHNEHGERIGVLEGPGIVGRNPAYVPSDMQKVEFVDIPMLRIYEDVVIMSVQGDVSLASRLGGGDYDGDDTIVIWDPAIVTPFNNAPDVPTPDTSHYFSTDKRTVGEVLESTPNNSMATALFERFLGSSVETEYDVGIYSKMHTKLADYRGLGHPDSLLCAALCAELLDARKGGKKLIKRPKWDVPDPDWAVAGDGDDAAGGLVMGWSDQAVNASASKALGAGYVPPPEENRKTNVSTTAIGFLHKHLLSRYAAELELIATGNVLVDGNDLMAAERLGQWDADLAAPWVRVQAQSSLIESHAGKLPNDSDSLALSTVPTGLALHQLQVACKDICQRFRKRMGHAYGTSSNSTGLSRSSSSLGAATGNSSQPKIKTKVPFSVLEETIKEEITAELVNLARSHAYRIPGVSKEPDPDLMDYMIKVVVSLAYTVSNEGWRKGEGERPMTPAEVTAARKENPWFFPLCVPGLRDVLVQIKATEQARRGARKSSSLGTDSSPPSSSSSPADTCIELWMPDVAIMTRDMARGVGVWKSYGRSRR
ncbi:RNA dependent RNA polymerase-domain-containing protein [Phlyctochytrium arcticum]|nr:RNA dependent RNA polymerase-domain-containing protein [Phlyctochytrium arcticum]